MRATEPGISNKEVARRLGITSGTLNSMIHKASKEGWLVFEDPLSRIEYEIVPKVVENLNYFLDQRDKTVTIEAAKGTIFKVFQEAKGLNEGSTTVLALKIEAAPPLEKGEQPKVIVGEIVGRPRLLEEGEE